MKKQSTVNCLLDVFFQPEYKDKLQAILTKHNIADINTLRKWAQEFNRRKSMVAFNSSTNEKWLELFVVWLAKQPNIEETEPYERGGLPSYYL